MSSEFASKRNSVLILNQHFFCCHYWTWCEFRVPLWCKFWVCIKEEFDCDFESIFFLLSLLDLMQVPNSALMRVLSLHQRGIQLWFKINFFSIAILELVQVSSSTLVWVLNSTLMWVRVRIKEGSSCNFKSTFFLLPLLALVRVSSSTLMWVPSSHQQGIQLQFLINFFYCHF